MIIELTDYYAENLAKETEERICEYSAAKLFEQIVNAEINEVSLGVESEAENALSE